MAEFVFTSPGAKFKEVDLTFVTSNVGITTLGLVGETLKGPAFEPIYIQDQTQLSQRFGNQSTNKFQNGLLQYQLPYVANAYLNESNQLWITRVLGLSGYDAGKAWAITLSAGVDPSTEGIVSSSSSNVPYSGNSYLGVTIYATGQTGTTFTGFTKINATQFQGHSFTFTATTVTLTGGTVHVVNSLLSGNSYSQYENMVLAVIRSRGFVQDNVNLPPTTTFNATNVTVSANTTTIGIGDMFGQFTLVATDGITTDSHTVTLNPNASSFIPNVLGMTAQDKKTKIWVQAVYPDLIEKLDADGLGYAINTVLIDCNSSVYTNYRTQYKTPETPWVVSQILGNKIAELFKFISISDGDAANQELKISIANIDPIGLTFDVSIRTFNDTDANPVILEQYSKCSLIVGTNNFIGQTIGTSDGEYTLQSKYVMVEMADGDLSSYFPAGFEGYMFNNYAISATSTTSGKAGIAPEIFYKTEYEPNERVNRVYLGMSNGGYDANGLSGAGINQNYFNYNGFNNEADNNTSAFIKTKGFHMDSGATGTYYDDTNYIGQFVVGAGSFEDISDIVDPTNPYFAIGTRKFTLVPAGGFDGWDVNRTSRSYGDLYNQGGIYDGVVPTGQAMNDFQAWETAINTFSNPEDVTINVFATPGINWSDQNLLVLNTIEMIEQQRTDSLYVIDTPDINIPTTIGSNDQGALAAQDIVDLLNTADIDTNYGCTYFPWIQFRDTQNNVNVYIPPTGEVVSAIAFTDNTAFPWFAPAGLNRGVTNAIKSKYKLSQAARDILYAGRINPMADYADVGTAIFGQKTLQVKDSALNRINVRRLLLQLKVLIANIAIRIVFEQNDQTTIDNFLAKATPVLDTIKRERGLTDFQLKMDSTINTPETMDRNELYGEIFIKPTRSVEFIGITFMITPSGASFADVGA